MANKKFSETEEGKKLAANNILSKKCWTHDFNFDIDSCFNCLKISREDMLDKGFEVGLAKGRNEGLEEAEKIIELYFKHPKDFKELLIELEALKEADKK